MRQRSRHNFYYKAAWNINSVTELNWTELMDRSTCAVDPASFMKAAGEQFETDDGVNDDDENDEQRYME